MQDKRKTKVITTDFKILEDGKTKEFQCDLVIEYYEIGKTTEIYNITRVYPYDEDYPLEISGVQLCGIYDGDNNPITPKTLDLLYEQVKEYQKTDEIYENLINQIIMDKEWDTSHQFGLVVNSLNTTCTDYLTGFGVALVLICGVQLFADFGTWAITGQWGI